jgi:hypothetical protein
MKLPESDSLVMLSGTTIYMAIVLAVVGMLVAHYWK